MDTWCQELQPRLTVNDRHLWPCGEEGLPLLGSRCSCGGSSRGLVIPWLTTWSRRDSCSTSLGTALEGSRWDLGLQPCQCSGGGSFRFSSG